jgi:hypothetical protein
MKKLKVLQMLRRIVDAAKREYETDNIHSFAERLLVNIDEEMEQKRQRFSGIEPRVEACQMCHKTKETALHEVWSKASPEGELRRLCWDCVESCAGG